MEYYVLEALCRMEEYGAAKRRMLQRYNGMINPDCERRDLRPLVRLHHGLHFINRRPECRKACRASFSPKTHTVGIKNIIILVLKVSSVFFAEGI
jgi:hypothetical protein